MIVFASTLGMILSIPGQTMGVSVFTDHLIRDLRISREDLSSAYMIGTLASGCLLPAAGFLFDRAGARILVVISSLSLATTLVYLGSSARLVAWIDGRELPGLAPTTTRFGVLTVGFFFVRFWGQGVLTMVSRAMLGKWFHRHRGIAAAVSGLFVTGAFAVAPRGLLWLIGAQQDWRSAWFTLAAICTGWAVLGWILYRDNPEECGLLMDGDPPPPSDLEPREADTASAAPLAPNSPRAKDTDYAPPACLREFTLREAMKTYSFWVISLALSLYGMISTGVTFHITSIGAKCGLDEDASVAIFVPMAFVSVATNFTGGWLSSRVRIRYLFLAMLVGQAVGMGALASFGTPLGRATTALGLGVAGGLFVLLITVIWPRFYGRAHVGAISGLNMAMTVIGSALGPRLFASAEARDGSYASSFFFGVVSAGVLALLAFGIDNPQRRSEDSR